MKDTKLLNEEIKPIKGSFKDDKTISDNLLSFSDDSKSDNF